VLSSRKLVFLIECLFTVITSIFPDVVYDCSFITRKKTVIQFFRTVSLEADIERITVWANLRLRLKLEKIGKAILISFEYIELFNFRLFNI